MKKWQFFTPGELKPSGWLRRQLEIQAKGLSGNLDKLWPDIRDSAWIGGDRAAFSGHPVVICAIVNDLTRKPLSVLSRK